jgi:preprotein translocase SecE subunit
VNSFYIKLGVATLVVTGLFLFVWRQGGLVKIAAYFAETREELRKCNWPTRLELWQTTVMVFVVIALLGAFTVGADFLILKAIRSLLRT